MTALPRRLGTAGLKPTNGVTDGSWNQSAWNLGASVHCHLTWTLFRVERKGRALRPQATLDWPGQSLLVLNGKADQIHKDHNHSLAKPVAHTDKCGSQTARVQGLAHHSPAISPPGSLPQPQRVHVYTRDLVITVLPGAPGGLHITAESWPSFSGTQCGCLKALTLRTSFLAFTPDAISS